MPDPTESFVITPDAQVDQSVIQSLQEQAGHVIEAIADEIHVQDAEFHNVIQADSEHEIESIDEIVIVDTPHDGNVAREDVDMDAGHGIATVHEQDEVPPADTNA